MKKKLIKSLLVISATGILLTSCSPKVIKTESTYKPFHPELIFVAKGACYSNAADICFIVTQELALPTRIQVGNYIGTKIPHAQAEYEKTPGTWIPLMLIDGEVYEDSNHLEYKKKTYTVREYFIHCQLVGLNKVYNK